MRQLGWGRGRFVTIGLSIAGATAVVVVNQRPQSVEAVTLRAQTMPSPPADDGQGSPSISTPTAATPPSGRSVFVDYEQLAQKASSGGRTDVAHFVQFFISRSAVNHVAPSVAERITSAEMWFRKGRQPGVSEDQIVSTLNTTVDRAGGSRLLKTNAAQVSLLRTILQRRVPHLHKLAQPWKASETLMSPAEATFVFSDLLTQKTFNSAYQVDPDAWVKDTGRRLDGAGGDRRDNPSRPKDVLPHELSDALYAAPSEKGILTEFIHAMLDQMGISR